MARLGCGVVFSYLAKKVKDMTGMLEVYGIIQWEHDHGGFHAYNEQDWGAMVVKRTCTWIRIHVSIYASPIIIRSNRCVMYNAHKTR